MKLWIILFQLIGLVINFTTSQSYENDFEVFKSLKGGPYESLYPDPSLDVSESTYLEEDDGENRRSFKTIDPEPKFTRSFLYISPDDVQDRLVREKREEPDEDYDYAKTYREFVRENFGLDENTAPLVAEDDDEKYGVTHSDQEYDRIKELSDKQSEESKKHPEFCKVVHKNGKQCTVCKDPKNNAESEACSYSSAPAPKKYAYKRERNYNSKDDDDNDNDEDDTYDEDASEKKEQKVPRNREPKKSNKSRKQAKKLSSSRGNAQPTENFNYARTLTSGDKRSKSIPSYDQSFKSSELNRDERPYVQQHAANVDKVLEEFKTRDWSKCQRKAKNGLTCYYCKDKEGVSHEECMFISGDSPKSKVKAYDENIDDKTVTPKKNTRRSRGSNARRSRIEESNRRVLKVDDVPQPENVSTGHPTEKRTIKRMVSVKYHGNEDEPISNKSVFYAKKVTHVTK